MAARCRASASRAAPPACWRSASIAGARARVSIFSARNSKAFTASRKGGTAASLSIQGCDLSAVRTCRNGRTAASRHPAHSRSSAATVPVSIRQPRPAAYSTDSSSGTSTPQVF